MASNVRGKGLGILLKSPQGDIIPQSTAFEFQATNNEAEYEALIAGLQLVKQMRIRYLQMPENLKIPIIHILHLAIDKERIMEIDSENQLMDPLSSQASQGSRIQPVRKSIDVGEIPIGENLKAFRINADRMTLKNATGQTPFSLVFGAETVIPTKMAVPTGRLSIRDPQQNEESLIQDLEPVIELRDLAKIIMAAYQQRVARTYNKNIRIRRFQEGDMILRKAF
ncbi:hypothetical protein QVD17_37884 [Tagetes erecta]|uniref:Reverse transcriptase RNase H-like domain-containing protein n=1 Tax=Tagetes erecta TaxID=13708 RepID=A0AAD8JXL8_TARER|nr:hypothetical protein QVD17_37884 [Tagetes erecta]